MHEFRSGNGTTWLDLTATLIGRYRDTRTDQLADPAALQAWLAAQDLNPSEPPSEDDLARARELREALHAAAKASLRQSPPPAAALRTIEAALARDQPLKVKRSSSGLRTVSPGTTSEALARVARSAVQDLSGPTRAHLRACGDDTCSGIFVDFTGRRHWCSDERCGNRARVRAHRARARGAKASD